VLWATAVLAVDHCIIESCTLSTLRHVQMLAEHLRSYMHLAMGAVREDCD